MTSPSVQTFEKDLSFNVQSIESNASAYVGLFRWGPANEIVKINSNESELQRRFFAPDANTAVHFLSAANFLLYSRPLWISRAIGSGALNAVPPTETPVLVENEDDYDNSTLTVSFIGRYPGELGNSLKVSVADTTGYTGWTYENEFEYAPETGKFHVIVIDEDGVISGTAGTVLERYNSLSTTLSDKRIDGTSAYINDVLKEQSNWILVGDSADIVFTSGVYETSLQGGVDDNVEANADYQTAVAVFDDVETVDIVRIFSANTNPTVQGYLVDAMDARLDAVAFTAPNLSDVFNNANAQDDVLEYFNTELNKNSSYGFAVDNWKLVYDKYRDTKVWIPCNSDCAGLHARIFVQARPWFSIFGLNNGQIKNVIRLAYNPKKTVRDELFKNNINSIISTAGEGTVLWGERTMYKANSAFRNLNVRSLFIVMKKSIAKSAKYLLGEINDETTRLLFRNATDQFLERIKSERGLIDKRVICDETNNTPQVIDSNEFVGDILVKPSRIIENIKLNFVAVGTSIDFTEIEGA